MAKRNTKPKMQFSAAMQAYYANSAGASVLNDYRTGNVHIIDCRDSQNVRETKAPGTRKLYLPRTDVA